MQTYADVKSSFDDHILPSVPADDEPWLNEAWNNYTDGEFSGIVAHYCPSYEDCPTEQDDDDMRTYILEAMGVQLEIKRVDRRPDNGIDWSKDARHWGFTLSRNEHEHEGFFSQGPAVRGDPDVLDVLGSLLLDTSDYVTDFDEWCDDTGNDTDSRRANATWEAIGEEEKFLTTAFTKGELSDLRELFEDR
jgi:hypothetical protein